MRGVIDDKYFIDIANALRQTEGAFEKDTVFYPPVMAEAIQYVCACSFENGSAKGYDSGTEAGKLAEQRAFWETYQDGGTRKLWPYAFYNTFWTDDTYNPIYLMIVGNTNINMFYNSPITNTKVPIDISGTTLNYTFRGAKIVTIPELIVDEETDIANGFTSASSLVNIAITGVFGKSVAMGACPLSADSMERIAKALKDFSVDGTAYSCTLTVKASAFEELEASEKIPPSGSTWAEYIDNKKWNLVKA